MGILGDFRDLFIGAINYVAGGIRDVITETLDIATEGIINVATDIRETFGFKLPKEELYAAKRKEWLELTPEEKEELYAAKRKEWLELTPEEKEERRTEEYDGGESFFGGY